MFSDATERDRHNETGQGMHYITVEDATTRNNIKVKSIEGKNKLSEVSSGLKTNPTAN